MAGKERDERGKMMIILMNMIDDSDAVERRIISELHEMLSVKWINTGNGNNNN